MQSEMDDIDDINPKYLVYTLGNELYGSSLVTVREVLKNQSIKSVPYMKSYFKGVINLRGQIISVVDMREKLGIKAAGDLCLIMVLEAGDRLIGAMVDDVVSVISLKNGDIKNNQNLSSKISHKFFIGVCEFQGRLVNLIDLADTLSQEDFSTIRRGA